MSDAPKSDLSKFNETLKRMLSSPPAPHKEKDAGLSPSASPSLKKDLKDARQPVKASRKAK
jgi:hypothetical protein